MLHLIHHKHLLLRRRSRAQFLQLQHKALYHIGLRNSNRWRLQKQGSHKQQSCTPGLRDGDPHSESIIRLSPHPELASNHSRHQGGKGYSYQTQKSLTYFIGHIVSTALLKVWSLRPSKGVWEVKITSYNTTILCSFLLSFSHKCRVAFPETCNITCDL